MLSGNCTSTLLYSCNPLGHSCKEPIKSCWYRCAVKVYQLIPDQHWGKWMILVMLRVALLLVPVWALGVVRKTKKHPVSPSCDERRRQKKGWSSSLVFEWVYCIIAWTHWCSNVPDKESRCVQWPFLLLKNSLLHSGASQVFFFTYHLKEFFSCCFLNLGLVR